MILAFVIAVSASGHTIGSDLLKLIISTCSGAPERSPVAAGDQARSQGLVP